MNAKIFLTDYASYTNGTQFEFGHWVDLDQFSDVEELQEYINNHFKECDKTTPLDSPREEIMITDYEGFPNTLYSESFNLENFKKLFKLKSFLEDNGLENFDNEDDNLLSLWNEYKEGDDQIYNFDDEAIEMLFPSPLDAFKAGAFGKINWSDDYFILDGYGNVKSFNDPSTEIDENELLELILENLQFGLFVCVEPSEKNRWFNFKGLILIL